MDFSESTAPMKKSKQTLNTTPIKEQYSVPISNLDAIFPQTPQTLAATNRRRSLRLSSTPPRPPSHQPQEGKVLNFTKNDTNSAKSRKSKVSDSTPVLTPGPTESRRKNRKCIEKTNVGVEKRIVSRSVKKRVYYKEVIFDEREFGVGDGSNPVLTVGPTESKGKRKCIEKNNVGVEKRSDSSSCKKRVYYKKVIFDGGEFAVGDDSIPVLTPGPTESKRKRKNNVGVEKRSVSRSCKKRVYYKKVVFDGGEFAVGDDVYVKRREDASSDDEDPEIEECRVCYKPAGRVIMIECDECLGGFHLKCLKPPLKEVPEGDWICLYCEAKKLGKTVEMQPPPPKRKKRIRTAKEKLLDSDLWVAHIESIWKEVDGTYWFRAHWYIIPEETAAGRQPHNLRRELYRTNDFADVEMESVIRHCYVMYPKEFEKARNEGDDVFLYEYEYDIHWHSFKRISEIEDNYVDDDETEKDGDWNSSEDPDFDVEYERENQSNPLTRPSPAHPLAANSRKGRFFGLQKIGAKKIPEHVRSHKLTEIEKAKATLLLTTLPKSLPCRTKEMEEITTFIKGAICEDQCLGRCLYIHGVPGTGKTMSVLAVMRSLRCEVDAGSIKPYCFVEINGLKLASPENIYSVIYEALNGHRVGWKKALQSLNERFSNVTERSKEEDRPCVLLIDELDLLVTRNQAVLYNILDWPSKPNSKLIVIGIANTMDLPEKLLPRISSRMGIQRLCFGPYNYQQLQEIILTRLNGVDAVEKPAIEFASRKVAAVSGDARRALEICRRAAELADYRVKKLLSIPNSAAADKMLVRMADVEAAIQEMFQAPHIQVMRSSSTLSKIFLAAMVYEGHKTGMSETTFDKLAITVSCLCTSNGEKIPGWDMLLKVGFMNGDWKSVLLGLFKDAPRWVSDPPKVMHFRRIRQGCKLGECRILLCEPGVKHKLQKLQLNFPSDDVSFALKDNKELPWLAKYL